MKALDGKVGRYVGAEEESLKNKTRFEEYKESLELGPFVT
jgi:hypothetical protein